MGKRKAKWQNDYITRTYDRINFLVRKGRKSEIAAAAAQAGKSVNAYINGAVEARMTAEGIPTASADPADSSATTTADE